MILSGTTQDSALEVPGCHRLLTFAFGQLGSLLFLTLYQSLNAGHIGIHG